MTLRRREFITLLGGVAAWPLAARAQQPPMPVVGFLGSPTMEGAYRYWVAAFREGLSNNGYIEGRNVAIEFRWAENHYDRLPSLAADLVQRHAAVIVTMGAVNAVLAAKAATTTIPIVFSVGSDPVQLGLVASLARPDGNLTGVTTLTRELLAKRLEILRELLPPSVTAIGLLVNPNNPNTETSVRELQRFAGASGWALHVVTVSTQSDFDKAIATLVQARVGGFLNATDAIFNSSSDRIVALASRYRIPAIFSAREAVENGGLMSYGGRNAEVFRLLGQYTARILKGEKPRDLPVQQVTRVEFVINLKTAKALGLSVPLALRVRADEVIE